MRDINELSDSEIPCRRMVRNWITGKWEPADEIKPNFKKRRSPKFVQFVYSEEVELARQTKNPLLAVRAELYRLWFQAWNKREPIVFNCSALGFGRDSVMRALKFLEQQGWVSIETSRGRSPRVKILKGFYRKRVTRAFDQHDMRV